MIIMTALLSIHFLCSNSVVKLFSQTVSLGLDILHYNFNFFLCFILTDHQDRWCWWQSFWTLCTCVTLRCVWEVPFWTVSRSVVQMTYLGIWVSVISCVWSPSDYTPRAWFLSVYVCVCVLMTSRLSRITKSSVGKKQRLFLTDILIRKWFRLHPLLLLNWNESL